MFESAPMTVWEETTAYFTFASQPEMVQFWFWLCVALCVIPIVAAIAHESKAERRHARR